MTDRRMNLEYDIHDNEVLYNNVAHAFDVPVQCLVLIFYGEAMERRSPWTDWQRAEERNVHTIHAVLQQTLVVFPNGTVLKVFRKPVLCIRNQFPGCSLLLDDFSEPDESSTYHCLRVLHTTRNRLQWISACVV